MTREELKVKEQFGRKIYWYKKHAWVAKYYTSKWWIPRDWYKVSITE